MAVWPVWRPVVRLIETADIDDDSMAPLQDIRITRAFVVGDPSTSDDDG